MWEHSAMPGSELGAVDVRVRHAEHVMGTVVSFDVPGSACHDGSLDDAIGWLHWVDRVFSPYRADSDVSLLARAEVTVDACAPEMAEVLAACAFVRDLSGGYFTAAPGGQFDPSGYVKGWAIERAAALLARAGSADHVVNGGGDVQCAGGRGTRVDGTRVDGTRVDGTRVDGTRVDGNGGDDDREPWRIGIADPLRPGRLALVVGARDCAVATSGTSERGPHILDPHTGHPASGLASLTIVGPRLALADAYATAAFAMGPARARDWTTSLEGYAAFAITDTGATWHTPGFARHIAPA